MKAWKADTEKSTKAAAASLRPGGRMVIVIGDGLTPLQPVR